MATGNKNRRQSSVTDKALSALGILLCIILVPILIINCTLLIKGYTSDEVPSFGGRFPMIVLSDSMYPEFSYGDLIICRTAEPEDVEVGDVISFFDPQGSGSSIISHRVLEITEEDGSLSFITKGDYNNAEDSVSVPEENLVGIYIGVHFAGVGNVAMFMQTVPGLIVCVVIPILLLVGYDVIRRWLYERKHRGEKEELLAELAELRRLKAQKEEEPDLILLDEEELLSPDGEGARSKGYDG
ncbi:MAG: signal peptidase I [Lachnospiraceae bacterium]|nr:signal peptidase I [Lachnospiraceae bacterium]